MRASRLLRMLLLLQNRGRLTSAALATELEVARRTVLRDVEALGEAGLPIVVHQGQRGGIELGFNYRTRLTGLAADEAEALGVLLTQPLGEVADLGMTDAARRARHKLLESLPDPVRERAMHAARRFRVVTRPDQLADDVRLPALAAAIRESRIVRIRAYQADEQTVHPVALVCQANGWSVEDQLTGWALALRDCGDINISSRTFVPHGGPPTPRRPADGPLGHG